MLSYKCPVKCRHCLYACSPEWKADWITEEDLEKGLSQLSGRIQASPWGEVSLNHGLHFSGGEPFLNFKLLLKAVEMANEHEIPSMFVETNCYWCLNDEATRDMLRRLKEAGLKGIMISVNPFYAEYVPFERTERCIRISQEVFACAHNILRKQFHCLFLTVSIDNQAVHDGIVIIGFDKVQRDTVIGSLDGTESFLAEDNTIGGQLTKNRLGNIMGHFR